MISHNRRYRNLTLNSVCVNQRFRQFTGSLTCSVPPKDTVIVQVINFHFFQSTRPFFNKATTKTTGGKETRRTKKVNNVGTDIWRSGYRREG